jgi:hypothetical protein
VQCLPRRRRGARAEEGHATRVISIFDKRWGDQQWEEMALGAFEVVAPRGASPKVLIDRHNR